MTNEADNKTTDLSYLYRLRSWPLDWLARKLITDSDDRAPGRARPVLMDSREAHGYHK